MSGCQFAIVLTSVHLYVSLTALSETQYADVAMALEIIDIKTMFGTWPKRSLDLSADDLVRDLRQYGVSRALTTASVAILYDDELGNQDTLEQCRSRPELIPAATMHPGDYLASENVIASLKEQGFRVFRFFNKLQGFSLDLYCFRRMLADLKQVGMPCIVDAVALEDPYRLARLSQDVGLDIICTGLGYSFEAEVIALAQDFPRLYFDAGRLTGPDGIKLFCRHVGAHRLVWGSDYPFDAILPSRLLLEQAEITEADREAIASGNIKELLHL
ncbi:MAG: amidohydrolase family protein [Anaerolineae bacterium]